MKNLIIIFYLFLGSNLHSQNVLNDPVTAFKVIDTDTILYYPSGKKYCEVHLQDGFICKNFYSESGEIQSKTYKFKKTESYSSFDKNGLMIEQGTTKKGKNVGYIYHFDSGGKVYRIDYYKRGKFINNTYLK